MHGDIDFKSLREKTHLTLSGLAELSGSGPADILRLERGEKVSRSMWETVFSILVQAGEEGPAMDARMWRDRALQAECRLELLTNMMKGWVDVL